MKLTKELAEVYYTAGRARDALGIDDKAFQYLGKTKRIQRIPLPGRMHPVYSKHEIDALATQTQASIDVERSSATIECEFDGRRWKGIVYEVHSEETEAHPS